jgi:hypothetical protein
MAGDCAEGPINGSSAPAVNTYHITYIILENVEIDMVFENLTLFEIQLDSAQFGPRPIGRSEDAHEAEIEADEDSGRGRRLPLFVLGLLAIGAAMLYRRSRSSDVELDAESEDAESDLATAQ